MCAFRHLEAQHPSSARRQSGKLGMQVDLDLHPTSVLRQQGLTPVGLLPLRAGFLPPTRPHDDCDVELKSFPPPSSATALPLNRLATNPKTTALAWSIQCRSSTITKTVRSRATSRSRASVAFDIVSWSGTVPSTLPIAACSARR